MRDAGVPVFVRQCSCAVKDTCHWKQQKTRQQPGEAARQRLLLRDEDCSLVGAAGPPCQFRLLDA